MLSNLGLSYALSKDLPRGRGDAQARAPPRGRTTDPRVRGNLALVVGLQGRFAEAEAIARADLPPDQAAANVAYLRQMIAQQSAAQGRPPAQARRPRRPGELSALLASDVRKLSRVIAEVPARSAGLEDAAATRLTIGPCILREPLARSASAMPAISRASIIVLARHTTSELCQSPSRATREAERRQALGCIGTRL